ncbi:hypothetical protein BPOR_0076g00160 [Botrytis porri]|uniref:Uncharacterized protein n=1 Tax=Botrytis porri TaxID=87229 RepID=A0A4Z1L0B0_9HELO|nr:hypothetical protein BPOR_0076g00160 [Botrytis porri]
MAAPQQPAEESLAAQIKSVDMSDDMSDEAIEVCRQAMAKHSVEKDIAQYIKKASFLLSDFFAETKHFIYFYLGHCAILLFKTQ